MLKSLVDHSIRYRGIVIVLAMAVVAYGIYTAMHAKLDVFPDFVQPLENPGASAEMVPYICRHIEKIQCLPRRCSIPDNTIIGAGLSQIYNEIEHGFFPQGRGRTDIVQQLVA